MTIIQEIIELELHTSDNLDDLLAKRIESELDNSKFDSIFHAIGYLAARTAVEIPEITDKRNFARILKSRLSEIIEGFSDAIDCHAEPEKYGKPHDPYIF